jgi:hypothetical protein
MAETILWRRIDRPGHESARLSHSKSNHQLSGAAVFAHEHQPCCLSYLIACDEQWQTRTAMVSGWVDNQVIDIAIDVDLERRWTLNGQRCDEVSGCIDIDLNFSPSTNLLPIRRLKLAENEQSSVRAAWLRFPTFQLEPLEQLYRHVAGPTYRYESAGGTFVADLEVNEVGFVTRYPGVWEIEG